MNLAFGMGESFDLENDRRDDSIDLDRKTVNEPGIGNGLVNPDISQDKIIPALSHISPPQHPAIIRSTTKTVDIKAELESLVTSLQLNPAPPSDLLLKCESKIEQLNTQMVTTNIQVLEIAETMRSSIDSLEQKFITLSTSVQTEKEQFYQLTVASIEKADAIGLQLASINKQMSEYHHSISVLKADFDSARHTIRQETEQKLHNLDLRYHQLISTWDDFQVRHQDRSITTKKLVRWLWLLSFAVVAILVILILVLTMLK